MLGHGIDDSGGCQHLHELHGVIRRIIRLSQPIHHGIHGTIIMQLIGHHSGVKLMSVWRRDINCGIGAMRNRTGINMIDGPQVSIKADCTPFLQKLAVMIDSRFEQDLLAGDLTGDTLDSTDYSGTVCQP
jgi:hypothetical protein